jgi:hypothetical protein
LRAVGQQQPDAIAAADAARGGVSQAGKGALVAELRGFLAAAVAA